MTTKARVLVTENEAIVAMEIEDRLIELGYEVVGVAATGLDAIQIASEHLPDIVLMDIMLIGDMNGIEAAQIIHEKHNIPVIFLTAYSDDETLTNAQLSEPYAYLLKPFTGRELHTNIEIALYRHKLESQIRESESLYRSFIEGTTELVQSINHDGQLSFVNNTWTKILGYSESEVYSLSIDNFVHPESLDKFKEYLNSSWKGQMNSGILLTLRAKNGSKVYVEGAMFPRIENDEVVSITGFFSDISRRKEAEENQRNAAATATFYIDLMGHDLRQSLQVMMTGMDILEPDVLTSETRFMFDLISEAIDTAEGIIRKVLSTRGLLEEPLHSVDLREAVISVIDTVSSNYPNVIVNSTIEVNKAKIQGDNYLPILLTNITENAFSQSKNSERHVWITLKDSLDGFQFIVEDDGPGIADDRKESLFDPNRRFGGVGIHQSMKIVEKYGGTIGVSDRIDGDYTQGAKFKIYIPRAD